MLGVARVYFLCWGYRKIMKVSVVITTYNQAEYLEECVESVLCQTYRNFEVILVDDASSDGTDIIVEKLARSNPEKIRTIRFRENKGQASAWNAAIELVDGEVVSFLDGDDVWFRNKLEMVVSSFGDLGVYVAFEHNLSLMRGGTIGDDRFSESFVVGDVFHRFKQGNHDLSVLCQAASSASTYSAKVLKKIGKIPSCFQTMAEAYLKGAAVCYGRISGVDECLGAFRVHDRNQNFENGELDRRLFLEQLGLPELNEFYRRNEFEFQLKVAPTPSKVPHLNLRRGDRILLVRSAPPGRIKELVSTLRKQGSGLGVTIDLLLQEGFDLDLSSGVSQVITISPGMMGRESITDITKAAVRGNEYDFVIIPYYNNTGFGYENVDDAILSIGLCCPILGIGVNGKIFDRSTIKGAKVGSQGQAPLDSWGTLRNCHQGRRAFIVGNGPSLSCEDLDRLKGEITFASNKIYLAFDDTAWRPSYYSVVDQLVAANNADRIRELDLPMLLPTSVSSFAFANENTLWYRESGFNAYLADLTSDDLNSAVPRFSRDAVYPIHGGYSVIYHQLQLAWHMGVREIYLIGVDFSFSVPKERVVDERFKVSEYRNALVSTDEVNHFHPDYRSPGETWSMPRLDLQACAFRAAARIFRSGGGGLFNASRKTELSELDLVNFDSLFDE